MTATEHLTALAAWAATLAYVLGCYIVVTNSVQVDCFIDDLGPVLWRELSILMTVFFLIWLQGKYEELKTEIQKSV